MRGDLGILESRANQHRLPCWFVPAPTIAPPPKLKHRSDLAHQSDGGGSSHKLPSALPSHIEDLHCESVSRVRVFTARRLWFVSTRRRSSLSCFRPRQFGSAQRSSSHYTLHTLRFLVGHPHPHPRSFRSVPSAPFGRLNRVRTLNLAPLSRIFASVVQFALMGFHSLRWPQIALNHTAHKITCKIPDWVSLSSSLLTDGLK
jgi:hypothetical protein